MASYTKRGVIRVATDVSMTTVLSNPTSQFRGALIDLLETVAAGIIANDPTLVAAAEAAVDAAFADMLGAARCIRIEGGEIVWKDPGDPTATHFFLPDHNGELVARTSLFPTPSATTPFALDF